MESLSLVLTAAIGYILGSIPAAYIVGRVTQRIDIRSVGSRNAGALNVYHQIGPAAAVAVLAADILKGAVAVLIPSWLGAPHWAVAVGAVAVVAGHNWPAFLAFRGGKSVAAVLGVSMAVLPWLTLISIGPAVLAILLTRNVVFAAAVVFLLLNVLTIITGQGWLQISLCLFLTLVVTGTYLGRSWRETLSALRMRRWTALFSFE